jgi:iron uptake system EfeUOB component EfeO/EfeM
MRRALLAVVLGLAACGGGPKTPVSRHPIAPPATREVEVTRIAGTDRSAREVADAAAGVPVNGQPRGENSLVPESAFDVPIAAYRRYSARQVAAMAAAVHALTRALAADDRPAARRAWGEAYERYLRIGAAYGALGDLDAAIVADRERLERGLWTGESLPALRGAGARLARDVRRLRRAVPTVEIAPVDYATRAHEILEDAQRDMLSGVAAPYSGAGVRATAASVDATDAVVAMLRPLLAGHGAIASVEAGLLNLRRELDRIRRAHGGAWPRLDALSLRERQHLGGRLGAGLEILAAIPHALETSYPPAIPELRP